MKCIIPARIGSKRIENKNFRDFFGRPIIQYSIDVARASKLFSDIVVATDGEARTDASYYHREPVSDEETLTEFLRTYITATGYSDKYICVLYACAPLTKYTDLIDAYALLDMGGFESVYCVPRREKREKWRAAGMFWFLDVAAFMASNLDNPFFPENQAMIEVEKWRALDIDTEEDWALAEENYAKYVLNR